MKKIFYLFIGIFVLFTMGFVSSQGCCLKANNGAYFQNVDSSDCATYPESFSEGILCENTNFVDNSGDLSDKGCCIDSTDNFECSSYTYRAVCSENNLDFEPSSSGLCSDISLFPNPCTVGCCVVNEKGYYENKMACEDRTVTGEIDFRDITETQCGALGNSEDSGACFNSAGECSTTKRSECANSEKFYSGRNCGDDSFKSCSANINGKTKTKKSGESWCIYEGEVGEGKDLIGSSQYIQSCVNGEIKTDSCNFLDNSGDYLCRELTTKDTGFTRAVCTPNLAEKCILLNSKYYSQINNGELDSEIGIQKLKDECNNEENKNDCMFLESKVESQSSSSFGFGVDKNENNFGYSMCVPRDSKNFEVGDSDSCSIATTTCTVYFQKNKYNRFECVENCECMGGDFFIEMNKLCMTMGDCGFDVNYVGKIGGNNISFKPEWDASVSRRFADGTISKYNAITDRAHLNVAKTVVPSAMMLIRLALYNKEKKTTSEPLQVSFPREVVEEILGNDAGSLTQDEINQKIVDYIESNQESLDSVTRLNQQVLNNNPNWDRLFKPNWKEVLLTKGFYPDWINPVYAVFGEGKDSIDITYICSQWTAPTGGDDCDKCMESEFGCTKDKCNSLGTACAYVGESNNPQCITLEDDGNSPKIKSISSNSGDYSINKISSEWNVDSNINANGCVNELSSLDFFLETDEPSYCKYSFDSYPTYDAMPNNFPLINEISDVHNFSVTIGNVLDLTSDSKKDLYYDCIESGSSNEECLNVAGINSAEGKINIMCKDYSGNFNKASVLNYCIKTGPDQIAPQVRSMNPPQGTGYEYNPGKVYFKIYLDENSECKYDTDNKINYDDMSYSMTQLAKAGNLGWSLSANVTSKLGENKIFIKCRDSSGNVNNDITYTFNIKRDIGREEYIRDFGVKINLIYMDKDGSYYANGSNITLGADASIKEIVETSGGINSGIAICYIGENKKITMKETNSTKHSQIYTYLNPGINTLRVVCTDGLSDDSTSIRFNLTIDTASPKIIKNYTEGDNLIIETDEESKCSYKENNANFNINDGDQFYDYDYSKTHTTQWNPAKNYYIRCIDKLGNEGYAGSIGEGINVGPIITRISYLGNEIIFNTDRKSSCYYSDEFCSFNMSSSNQIGSDLVQEHSLNLEFGKEYFIKCKDQFNSVNSECTLLRVF